MKKYWKKSLFIALAAFVVSTVLIETGEFLTFAVMKSNSVRLSVYVNSHYLASLLVFACCFVGTSFLLPGALGLTVIGGFLFGTVPGALYACFFSTAGSTLAFLASRHVIGERIQERYGRQMERFNREIDRYGTNYLFVMRIVPVLPAFLINYLSGVTQMPAIRFAAVSFLAMMPGALIYSAAGRELAVIERPQDILSPGIVIGFLFLAGIGLAPVLYARLTRRTGRR